MPDPMTKPILKLPCTHCHAQHEVILDPKSSTHILCQCEACGSMILYPLRWKAHPSNTCDACGRSLIILTGPQNDAPLCTACLACLPRSSSHAPLNIPD